MKSLMHRVRNTAVLPAALLAAATLAGCAWQAPIALKEMGSFHVGGREVTISGKPVKEVVFTPGGGANKRGALPLLMWHGGGLTGVTYETTPDGREGWLNYFVKKGWAVYNSDAVERGRSGWAMYPDVFKGETLFLTKANPFERFRIGQGAGSWNEDPAKRRVLAGSQFPMEGYEQFVKQSVPRWTTTDDATIRAYTELVDKVGLAITSSRTRAGRRSARSV